MQPRRRSGSRQRGNASGAHHKPGLRVPAINPSAHHPVQPWKPGPLGRSHCWGFFHATELSHCHQWAVVSESGHACLSRTKSGQVPPLWPPLSLHGCLVPGLTACPIPQNTAWANPQSAGPAPAFHHTHHLSPVRAHRMDGKSKEGLWLSPRMFPGTPSANCLHLYGSHQALSTAGL